MAGVAGETAGVICRHDLRKILWLGAVGFVTAGADDGGVEFGWLERSRIIGVLGLRSVAGFAGDHDVLAEFFLVDDVGVACLADVMSGVGDRAGGRLGDGVSAVVSVLAKAFWNDGGTQDDECDECNHYHSDESDEVLDVFEQGLGSRARGRIAQKKARCSWIPGKRAGNDDLGHRRV